MSKIVYFFFFAGVFLNTTFSHSQNFQLTESASISLLTCGVGNESHSFYGHTALRIKDDQRGFDIVYNFGHFDFNTPNFIVKFSKGDLQYFVGINDYRDFEYSYRYDNRSIFEQVLNLSAKQKQQLFDKLNQIMHSEEKFYTYKFIDRNCTTMVIDRLNEILGSEVIVTPKPVEITYRDILYPYQKPYFFENLGINIIFGTKADAKAETLFLPLELMEAVRKTTYNGTPLTNTTTTIFKAEEKNEFPIINSIYMLAVVLLFLLVLKKQWIHWIYFILLGTLGLFMIFMGFYSFHEELSWNYNVLLFNPILLAVVWYEFKNKQWLAYRLALLNLGSIAIYLILIFSKVQLLVIWPILLATVYLLMQTARNNRRRIAFRRKK